MGFCFLICMRLVSLRADWALKTTPSRNITLSFHSMGNVRVSWSLSPNQKHAYHPFSFWINTSTALFYTFTKPKVLHSGKLIHQLEAAAIQGAATPTLRNLCFSVFPPRILDSWSWDAANSYLINWSHDPSSIFWLTFQKRKKEVNKWILRIMFDWAAPPLHWLMTQCLSWFTRVNKT